MSKIDLWLQLTDEFGGTAFGPIEGAEFRVGTAEDNHVRIAEGLGVEPHHVRLVRKSGDTFFLAPVERSASVWLYRAGQRQATAVQGPTVILPGDGFSLVTPEGVRFRLITKESHRAKKQHAGPKDPANRAAEVVDRYKRGIAHEISRRFRAAVLATYIGRMIQNVWFFVRTGQFLSPVYLVSFFLFMSGWGYGFNQCRGKRLSVDNATKTQTALDQCKIDLQTCQGSAAGGETVDLAELTARILKDPTWRESLKWDDMRTELSAEMKDLFAKGSDAESRRRMGLWYLGRSNPHSAAATALESAGLQKQVASLLAWGTVDLTMSPKVGEWKNETTGTTEMWGILAASDNEMRACRRGPFRLTWRQAYNLGMTAPSDALFSLQESAMFTVGAPTEDMVRLIQGKMNGTRLAAGAPELPLEELVVSADTMYQIQQQDGTCIVLKEPTDQRLSASLSASALASRLGPKVSTVPSQGSTNWQSGRVALMFASNLPNGQFDSLHVGVNALGESFASVKEKSPAGYELIARQTGRTIARAVTIPCLLTMSKDKDTFPEHLGEPPTFDDCALLMARVEYELL